MQHQMDFSIPTCDLNGEATSLAVKVQVSPGQLNQLKKKIYAI